MVLVCEQADAQSLCRDIDPHGGKVQECLTSNRFSLSYDCQAELFRQEQEDSEDLRLSVRLFHKCLNDKIQVGHCALAQHVHTGCASAVCSCCHIGLLLSHAGQLQAHVCCRGPEVVASCNVACHQNACMLHVLPVAHVAPGQSHCPAAGTCSCTLNVLTPSRGAHITWAHSTLLNPMATLIR